MPLSQIQQACITGDSATVLQLLQTHTGLLLQAKKLVQLAEQHNQPEVVHYIIEYLQQQESTTTSVA